MEFKIGSVVKLKSGSPLMTVYEIKGDRVSCTWFVDGRPEYREFIADTLMLSV